jgi:ketosteroid isomerase-like protein
MAENNSRIISNLYEAFARRDMQALLQWIDPQIEITQTTELPWGGTFQGQLGLMSFAGKLLQSVDSQVEPEELVEAGDRVVAIGRTRGHVRANNKEFDVRAVHVWTLKYGKVLRFEAYIDTPKMLEALEG